MGASNLDLKLTPSARKSLKQGRTLHVKVRFIFTPTGGTAKQPGPRIHGQGAQEETLGSSGPDFAVTSRESDSRAHPLRLAALGGETANARDSMGQMAAIGVAPVQESDQARAISTMHGFAGIYRRPCRAVSYIRSWSSL